MARRRWQEFWKLRHPRLAPDLVLLEFQSSDADSDFRNKAFHLLLRWLARHPDLEVIDQRNYPVVCRSRSRLADTPSALLQPTNDVHTLFLMLCALCPGCVGDSTTFRPIGKKAYGRLKNDRPLDEKTRIWLLARKSCAPPPPSRIRARGV